MSPRMGGTGEGAPHPSRGQKQCFCWGGGVMEPPHMLVSHGQRWGTGPARGPKGGFTALSPFLLAPWYRGPHG